MSQRQIAAELGISQPAVSEQVKFAPDPVHLPPRDLLLEAAAPVLEALAAERGYSKLAVFGSVARPDSDIDLIVRAPKGISSFDFVEFRMVLEEVPGREIEQLLGRPAPRGPGRRHQVRAEQLAGAMHSA